MRRSIGVGAAVGVTLLLAGTEGAVAHTTHTPTDIIIVQNAEGPVDHFGLYGFLDAPKKCRAKRRVEILFDFGNGFEVVDRTKSSLNGNWAGSGDLAGRVIADAKVTVGKKNIGPSGHRHLCEATPHCLSLCRTVEFTHGQIALALVVVEDRDLPDLVGAIARERLSDALVGDLDVSRLQGHGDLVVVGAPCSGWWRRGDLEVTAGQGSMRRYVVLPDLDRVRADSAQP